jgi:hypothetical protein
MLVARYCRGAGALVLPECSRCLLVRYCWSVVAAGALLERCCFCAAAGALVRWCADALDLVVLELMCWRGVLVLWCFGTLVRWCE